MATKAWNGGKQPDPISYDEVICVSCGKIQPKSIGASCVPCGGSMFTNDGPVIVPCDHFWVDYANGQRCTLCGEYEDDKPYDGAKD